MNYQNQLNRTAGSFNRRQLLRSLGVALAGAGTVPWFRSLAEEATAAVSNARACILLWMSGGPSQIDTLDPKPGHENGGGMQSISTSIPGIQIAQTLPKVSQWMDHMAIIRSMQTAEGDHQRAAILMHTGYKSQGPVRFPTMGSLVSHELASAGQNLPGFVSISPNTFLGGGAHDAGFLGPSRGPLIVGNYSRRLDPQADAAENFRVPYLEPENDAAKERIERRVASLAEFDSRFKAERDCTVVESHLSAYEQAVRMMQSSDNRAFNLDEEPQTLRDAYGNSTFGQGCLLARRLVERGVRFVEVSHNIVQSNGVNYTWDSHQQNTAAVTAMCGPLDSGWSSLLGDLKQRGLLDSTLVIWMGEFGRTPTINRSSGRDHYPAAWSVALAGGGILGGQVVGATSDDGTSVKDRPVTQADLTATIFLALGLNPSKQNMSNVGRPIRLADPAGQAIKELLG